MNPQLVGNTLPEEILVMRKRLLTFSLVKLR
jgi:hypothetical protein